MRSNQRWMMIFITILVIVSFLWFFTDRTNIDKMTNNKVGSVYGRPVTASEFDRVQRRMQVAYQLGTMDILRAASGDGYDQQDLPINCMVIEHEAEQLGIRPTDDEIRAAGEKLRVFRGANGEFDDAKKNEFVSSQLDWRGLGANQIDELVKLNLMAMRLREVVTAGVVVSPEEARTRYDESHSRTEASVIRLKTADATPAEPTDDEIKKYYDEQKNQFKQPEKRRVQYVKFAVDETQGKLTDKARIDALTQIGGKAVDFLEKLLDQKTKEDFAATAAAEKLPFKETTDFDEDQTTGFEEASIPQFAQAAFQLSKQSPDSNEPLQAGDAFYDLHLVSITPERPLTLEEARPKIVEALKAERSKTALAAKAEEIRAKVMEAVKAGKSFADAAKDAGQTAEDIAAFSLADMDGKTPGLDQIANVSQGLAIGEISKFEPDGDGGMFVFVRNRLAADEGKFESMKAGITTQLQTQKSQIYFLEWLRTSRDNADVRLARRLQS